MRTAHTQNTMNAWERKKTVGACIFVYHACVRVFMCHVPTTATKLPSDEQSVVREKIQELWFIFMNPCTLMDISVHFYDHVNAS